MNYVTELSDVLRDSNVSHDDKQAVLNSLRDLADKGDPEAKTALDTGLRIPLSPLQGKVESLSFAAVFDLCCKAGWSQQAFEFWNRWRSLPMDVIGGLDTSASRPSLAPSYVDAGVLYSYCNSRGMSVPECHVFLDKLGETDSHYDRLAYAAAACDREGRSISNYRWYLLKLVWDSKDVPEYDWCSHELLEATLDKFLPVAELTQPLFKEVAALERELLLLNIRTRNEKVAVIKNRPRVRELAAFFTSRPDTKVYLPDSLYHVFWEMKPAS